MGLDSEGVPWSGLYYTGTAGTMGAACTSANRRQEDEDLDDEQVSWTIGNLGFTQYAPE